MGPVILGSTKVITGSGSPRLVLMVTAGRGKRLPVPGGNDEKKPGNNPRYERYRHLEVAVRQH
jgi:hypothetical protein